MKQKKIICAKSGTVPKQKRVQLVILSALLLCIITINQVKAQTLNIKEKNGTESMFNISAIQKLTFRSGKLNVVPAENSLQEFPLSTIRYLHFNVVGSQVAPLTKSEDEKFIVYPNPANEVLTIKFVLSKSQPVQFKIISTDGRVIYFRRINSFPGENIRQIDVTPFTPGLYLCQLIGETHFFSKKILVTKK